MISKETIIKIKVIIFFLIIGLLGYVLIKRSAIGMNFFNVHFPFGFLLVVLFVTFFLGLLRGFAIRYFFKRTLKSKSK